MRNFLVGLLLAMFVPIAALLFLLLLAKWQAVERIDKQTKEPLTCYEIQKEDLMSIDAKQFRNCIIRPTLKELHPVIPYSKAAENLLMGTAAQESHLGTYLEQIRGPAKGVFQMEPRTHEDIWDNFIRYTNGLHLFLERDIGAAGEEAELVWNLKYATAMARIHYWRVPEKLPKANDLEGLARYWKQYYNTPKGKGTTKEFIRNYKKYVG